MEIRLRKTWALEVGTLLLWRNDDTKRYLRIIIYLGTHAVEIDLFRKLKF